MTLDWFYLRDEQEFGPVSKQHLAQLASAGKLMPNDLVKEKNSHDWIEARLVQGLFEQADDEEKRLTGTAPTGAGLASKSASAVNTELASDVSIVSFDSSKSVRSESVRRRVSQRLMRSRRARPKTSLVVVGVAWLVAMVILLGLIGILTKDDEGLADRDSQSQRLTASPVAENVQRTGQPSQIEVGNSKKTVQLRSQDSVGDANDHPESSAEKTAEQPVESAVGKLVTQGAHRDEAVTALKPKEPSQGV